MKPMIKYRGGKSKEIAGKKWNKENQCAFMEVLKNENFFNGKGENEPSFSARDRINRAPKSLGFVRLSPTIELTPAGEKLITSRRKDEAFLRQMLKFQVPSPYHKPSSKAAKFCVKPYLEIQKMVEDSYKASYLPNSDNIKAFFETSNTLAQQTEDERAWYKGISEKAMNWLG